MRIALFISGGGTTAGRIILASKSGKLEGVTPALVVSSKADAPGIGHVKDAGVAAKDVVVLRPHGFHSSDAFGEAIIRECKKRGVDFIGQYGWLVRTPANVIEAFKGMMVNQHPGPLDPGRPDFGGRGMFGRRVHCARLLFVRAVNRDFWTEATAQRVAANYDEGMVLKRKQVLILPDDDVVSLQTRVLPVEYEVQIQALRDFANGAVQELQRETSLILPGEEPILEEAKRKAIEMYPAG
ncbi:hypothetical protein C4571_03800 [Candidatus Parcubacteria bacterium]|nr:MAG: hypothetical protein C4571_03800 [Candidatus Parcubacteria bacterium]